jgi:transcriptional regulator with XRE-family HTH domain
MPDWQGCIRRDPQGRIRPDEGFPDRLTWARVRQGWSIRQAGEISEISAKTWGRWESGKVSPYLGAVLTRAAESLGVSVPWLLAGKE